MRRNFRCSASSVIRLSDTACTINPTIIAEHDIDLGARRRAQRDKILCPVSVGRCADR